MYFSKCFIIILLIIKNCVGREYKLPSSERAVEESVRYGASLFPSSKKRDFHDIDLTF